MYKASRILKLALLASLVAAMALMISCTREIEVPGETIIVEKEVVKTVEVPVQTVIKEVVKEVEVEKIVVMAAAKPVGYMMTAPERVSNRGGIRLCPRNSWRSGIQCFKRRKARCIR